VGKVSRVKNSARLGRALLALVCFSAVAACSDAQDEKPTYDEAIKNLVADAEAILASDELRRSGSVVATEKAETDQSGQCPYGSVRRFYRAQGDLAASYKSPHVVTGLVSAFLGLKRYDDVVSDLEVRDDDLAIVVSRKDSVGVTFTMAVRKDKRPNILIIGKTDCFETGADQ
jgi:hypothetical protein